MSNHNIKEMFCDKDNVNILTALLAAHGIRHAVVCPGSRNAPIVHNLKECEQIECHPVTDERSAGFYALGLALATASPVAVCVTSGSALLNVAPAAAEAFYRHVPIIIISADRPAQWIGQLDGQTMPQTGALGCFVKKAVCLPEPNNDEQRWMCNRLVNEAITTATIHGWGPVHINVPITEPLFSFTTRCLPKERVFTAEPAATLIASLENIKDDLAKYQRIMTVIGQTWKGNIDDALFALLSRDNVLIAEPLSNASATSVHPDEAVCDVGDDPDCSPDLVIYIGGTVVSKRVRRYLRRTAAPTWLLTVDGYDMPDPTMNLKKIIECSNWQQLDELLNRIYLATASEQTTFSQKWHNAMKAADLHAHTFAPAFSQMETVKTFEEEIEANGMTAHIHYANSTAIRLANIYARHYVWCNRGLNGIEGSLSTAAGFSLATEDKVFCVIGDLSFFYDQNALWNTCLRGNLRILLLNNRCGGIFKSLPGLEKSDAADDFVAAAHHTDARGTCLQNKVVYIEAHDSGSMKKGVRQLINEPSERPMLLEVFTDADEDSRIIGEYLRMCTSHRV